MAETLMLRNAQEKLQRAWHSSQAVSQSFYGYIHHIMSRKQMRLKPSVQ